MLKALAMDNYLDGFSSENFSCIDIPIAGATGYYHYDNYFYFLCYRSVFNNWSNDYMNECYFDFDQWMKQTNDILIKLGLILRVHVIQDATQLRSHIKKSIDQHNPVIMPVTYGSLFYNISAYMNEPDEASAVIVSEYDEEKSVVVIRDKSHVLDVMQENERGDPLCRLQLTEDMLWDIWEKSNQQFKKMHGFFNNKLLVIDKIDQPQIASYQDLICDFMGHFLYNSCNFLKIIDGFNQNVATVQCHAFIVWLQRDFKNALMAFYDCFEKALPPNEENTHTYAAFSQLFSEFMHVRNNIISTLHINTYRKKTLSPETMVDLKNKIASNDQALFAFIETFYKNNPC